MNKIEKLQLREFYWVRKDPFSAWTIMRATKEVKLVGNVGSLQPAEVYGFKNNSETVFEPFDWCPTPIERTYRDRKNPKVDEKMHPLEKPNKFLNPKTFVKIRKDLSESDWEYIKSLNENPLNEGDITNHVGFVWKSQKHKEYDGGGESNLITFNTSVILELGEYVFPLGALEYDEKAENPS
jgi:hypothetical protein